MVYNPVSKAYQHFHLVVLIETVYLTILYSDCSIDVILVNSFRIIISALSNPVQLKTLPIISSGILFAAMSPEPPVPETHVLAIASHVGIMPIDCWN